MPKRNGSGHALEGHNTTSEDAFQRQRKRSPAARIIKAALQAHPGGCVGWFLDHDHDENGFVPADQMVEDLVRCCRLTTQDAWEFVGTLAGAAFNSSLIPLSSLWVALHEHLEDLRDDAPPARVAWGVAAADIEAERNATGERRWLINGALHGREQRYQDVVPASKLEWEEFVLLVSRRAVGIHNDILDRQHHLEESIRLEALRLQDLSSESHASCASALL